MELLFIMHPFDILNLDNGARLIFTLSWHQGGFLAGLLKTLQAAGADAVITLMPGPSWRTSTPMPCPSSAMHWGWPGANCRWRTIAPRNTVCRSLCQPQGGSAGAPGGRSDLAIHCRGGSGRTGLMAAILLLESGYAPTQVKSLVQGVRPKALTLAAHLNYLNTHYAFAG